MNRNKYDKIWITSSSNITFNIITCTSITTSTSITLLLLLELVLKVLVSSLQILIKFEGYDMVFWLSFDFFQ